MLVCLVFQNTHSARLARHKPNLSGHSTTLLPSYTSSPHWGPHESGVVSYCLHSIATTQTQYYCKWKWKKSKCRVWHHLYIISLQGVKLTWWRVYNHRTSHKAIIIWLLCISTGRIQFTVMFWVSISKYVFQALKPLTAAAGSSKIMFFWTVTVYAVSGKNQLCPQRECFLAITTQLQ